MDVMVKMIGGSNAKRRGGPDARRRRGSAGFGGDKSVCMHQRSTTSTHTLTLPAHFRVFESVFNYVQMHLLYTCRNAFLSCAYKLGQERVQTHGMCVSYTKISWGRVSADAPTRDDDVRVCPPPPATLCFSCLCLFLSRYVHLYMLLFSTSLCAQTARQESLPFYVYIYRPMFTVPSPRAGRVHPTSPATACRRMWPHPRGPGRS